MSTDTLTDTQPTTSEIKNTPSVITRSLKRIRSFARSLYSLIGTLFVIGFSLLPLSALLAALPLVSPNEAVLRDTVTQANTRWQRLRRRLLGACAGLVVLTTLFAFALTIVNAMPLPDGGQLSTVCKKILVAHC